MCRRDHGGSVTAGTADLRKRGSPAWRRRRDPQGFRPKGRDMAAALESDSSPTRSPASVLVVVHVPVTHSRSMTSRPLLVIRAQARRMARRRHALEPAKKCQSRFVHFVPSTVVNAHDWALAIHRVRHSDGSGLRHLTLRSLDGQPGNLAYLIA